MTRRPQAVPLVDDGWHITRADLVGFTALLLMGAAAFGIWRAFS
jgi:hypothetical protein